jgi:AcrR family transcriptional regulator
METAARETSGAARRDQMVKAARATLATDGFDGASARAIARRGGFNQALIFYHFGSVMALLLSALEASSEERLERYREATRGVPGGDLLEVARDLYREDLKEGHITILTEMIAGSLSRPGLRAELGKRMTPWIDFATERIEEILEELGLGDAVPARILATGVVALYLGLDLLAHLDEDARRAEALFEAGASLSNLVESLAGGGKRP